MTNSLTHTKAQERVTLGTAQELHFDIDLTLYDAETGAALCVLDTKYKAPDKPSHADIFQIMAYAEVKHCREAVLIYPTPVPFDERLGEMRVRSLTFATEGDLEQAGQAFLGQLLSLFSIKE